jgi:uncharacterized YccA/Bax inhibitor family protein
MATASSLRTSNPVLNAGTFTGLEAFGTGSSTMTVQGAVNKTAILLALLLAAASWTWYVAANAMANGGDTSTLMPWMFGGLIGGLIFAFATIFKKTWAPVTAPLYAICEGLALGALSSVMNMHFHGIVIQAVAMTFGVLLVMLAGYTTGVIRVTQKFRAGVVGATGAVFLFYIVTFVMSLFGMNMSAVYGSGLLSIGISLIVVVIAALNLALDFDFIEAGALNAAPKYMEWYGAFGLMVTLVWLYIEILRLLSKFRSRN